MPKHAPANLEALWTLRQCAAYLSKSTSWLYKNHGSMGLGVPSYRIGCEVVFSPERVRAWVEARQIGVAAQTREASPSPSRFQLAKERIANRSLTRPDTVAVFSEPIPIRKGR